LTYYLPRQIALYQNYNGIPNAFKIDLNTIYHPSIHNALVITNNGTLYQYTLFALNDPQLTGDVIYALAYNYSDYNKLHQTYPDRTLYLLVVQADGSVSYVKLDV
jgi:hypothetical protein